MGRITDNENNNWERGEVQPGHDASQSQGLHIQTDNHYRSHSHLQAI